MKKFEIYETIYHYAVVLRALDVVFSRRKYNKLWISPSRGFDIYKSAGGDITQMLNEARLSGFGDYDAMEIACYGLLLKPVGWKDGFSVGISKYTKKGKEVRIKLYLRYPGITDSGPGWCFSIIISPTRTVIKPVIIFSRAESESQKLLALFGNKKSIIISK